MAYSNICIALPSLKCGGTERTAVEMANYIANQGGNITLLLMYKKDKFYTIHPNVTVVEPELNKSRLGKYLYTFLLQFYIRNELKKQKPDFVFALGYIAFTLFASLGLKTKVVLSGRSSPLRVRFPKNIVLNKVYSYTHKLLRSRVDGIIAQTSLAEKIYRSRFKCPIVVIPNFLRKLTDHKQKRKDQIINVGRYSFEKGQHFLLEAFSKLKAGKWKLVLVGDGPRREKLESMARSLNITERVLFTGFQDDVDFYLSQSKIFALTSIIEGYPNALIEAMATPLPSVSFDCEAGPSDIIRDGENGFLIDVGDIEKLTCRLQQLIDDPDLRERIQLNAMNIRYDNEISKIAPKYLDFLEVI